MRFATAGTRFFIGTPMEDLDRELTEDDFDAMVWTEVHNHTSIGSVGDTAQEVSSDEIERGRTIRVKGSRNAGTQTLTVNINTSDPGQAALLAAERTNHNYAFRMVYPDAPAAGANPTGSQRLYIGMVMSAPENLGGSNQFAAMDINIAVNSNIVKVPASAGA